MPSFNHWWNCRGEVVEPFNERRGGQSGVEKFSDPELGVLYIKRQVGHIFRSLRYPLGKPTAIRERDAYKAFAQIGLKTPELVFVEARKHQGDWQAILVTRDLSGFSPLQDWYIADGPARLGAENYRGFLQKLGRTLAQLHRHRWCHGSLHFLHIYITPGDSHQLPEIAFLDLERAQRKVSSKAAAKRDLRTLKRRAPVINGKALLSDHDWDILLGAHQDFLRFSQ